MVLVITFGISVARKVENKIYVQSVRRRVGAIDVTAFLRQFILMSYNL